MLIVENTTSTEKNEFDSTLNVEPGGDGPKVNTAGIAIVLHNDGPRDPGGFVGTSVFNNTNTSDNFVTFFDRDQINRDRIVGRIEGLSTIDIASVQSELALLTLQLVSPFNWMKFDIEFNDPAEWLQIT